MNAQTYFEFFILDADGMPKENTRQRINTVTGLILNCHPACEPNQVRHLAEIARQTRDYPVDIAAWTGPEGDRRMIWSARIFYRSKAYGHDRDNKQSALNFSAEY